MGVRARPLRMACGPAGAMRGREPAALSILGSPCLQDKAALPTSAARAAALY